MKLKRERCFSIALLWLRRNNPCCCFNEIWPHAKFHWIWRKSARNHSQHAMSSVYNRWHSWTMAFNAFSLDFSHQNLSRSQYILIFFLNPRRDAYPSWLSFFLFSPIEHNIVHETMSIIAKNFSLSKQCGALLLSFAFVLALLLHHFEWKLSHIVSYVIIAYSHAHTHTIASNNVYRIPIKNKSVVPILCVAKKNFLFYMWKIIVYYEHTISQSIPFGQTLCSQSFTCAMRIVWSSA